MTGRVIAGRYNLAEPIGRGAMGVVWRARDVLLDRDVAIKEVVLNSAIGEDERQNAYKRTLREARTAARLSHRGVVTVYDVAEEDGRPWIVMELVPSRSLDQIVTSDGPLSPRRACQIGQQLLAALAAAHAAGVLHRDVKPSNVLVAKNGLDGERAVLTDFGIAQFEGDPRLTQTGMVMGSPGFTAPERIRGGSATPASDLWSLGATLYSAVEGSGPYEHRGGPITTMSAIINEDAPVAPSAARLGPVIAALLRRNPLSRPSAMAAARMFAEILPLLPEQRPAPVRRTPTVLSMAVPAPVPSASVNATASDATAKGVAVKSPKVDEAVADRAASGDPAPEDAISEDAVCADAASGEATIESDRIAAAAQAEATAGTGAAPGDKASEDKVPEDKVPEDKAPGDKEDEAAEAASQEAEDTDGTAAEAEAESPGETDEAAAAVEESTAAESATVPESAVAEDVKKPSFTWNAQAENAAGGQAPWPVRDRSHVPAQPRPSFSAARPAAPAGPRAMPQPRPPLSEPAYAPPGGPGYGAGGQRGRFRRGRLAALVAALLVVAAAVGATVAMLNRHRPDPPPAPKTAENTTRGGSAAPPASVQAIDNPAPGLPAGWTGETVPPSLNGTSGGFTIGVPAGWQITQEKLATHLNAPAGARYMDIDLTPHKYTDMVAEAEYIERNAVAEGHFPGYHRISIKAVTVRGTPGAFWAFTWVRPNGVTMRVDDLLFILRTPAVAQSYAIYFTAPNADFGHNGGLPLFQQMLRTFEPVNS
jgi:hypothetical protein